MLNFTWDNTNLYQDTVTAQNMKFSLKDVFSKCDQIRRKMRIRSHLLKKHLMENFIFLCNMSIYKLFIDWQSNLSIADTYGSLRKFPL